MNYKFDGDRLFFTSDTHFNHTNILQYCNRPFKTVDKMNETIITNWNNVVGSDDVVFHLGDFCLGGADEWNKILDRLNGRIYLVLGNHDLKNIRQGFIDRFEHVAMSMCIQVGKKKIYLNHFPICAMMATIIMMFGSCSVTFILAHPIPVLMPDDSNISSRHSLMSG